MKTCENVGASGVILGRRLCAECVVVEGRGILQHHKAVFPLYQRKVPHPEHARVTNQPQQAEQVSPKIPRCHLNMSPQPPAHTMHSRSHTLLIAPCPHQPYTCTLR